MKKKLVVLMCLMMFFVFVGCGNKNTDEALGAVELEVSNDEKVYQFEGWTSEHYNDDMKGLTLNLYGVTDKVRPILDAFEVETGIKIEHLTMKNGEILQRLENEHESGVVIADLWFTGGADTFINASFNDLLLKYESENGKDLGPEMKDSNGYWYGTSLTLVNWVINVELIKEKNLKMPESWDDLLQEGLKGEVSMSNPASSGTAYNVVSAMLELKGEEEGWKYLDKLIEQVAFFTARGSDPAKMVVNGEAIVGINASNGDRELEINNAHIKIVYPSDGTGWWPQPVAIINGTKNEDASKVFIDWIVSKKGMEVIANSRYAAVARTDVVVPEGIIDINMINLFTTDFKANAEKRESVLEEWKKHVE